MVIVEVTVLKVALDATSVPLRPTGAGRYVVELARALARREDVELTLLARRGDRRWAELVGGTRHRALDVAPAPRPVRLAWEQLRLPALLDGLDVAVHHGPHYTAPERARVPTVVTIHDLLFFDRPDWYDGVKGRFFRRAIRVAVARAAAVVCVSSATATRVRELLAPSVPVHVIAHGVDSTVYHPAAGPPPKYARPPYLAFVGTLERRKDVPTLLRAFERIAGRHPDLSLVLAGLPSPTSDVAGLVAASPYRQRIRLTGYVPEEDLPPLLANAAAAVYPSLGEGFGLPALEAMACGAPVVTTAGSVMEEVVGEAAVLVPPGDPAALARALDSLLRGSPGGDARRRKGLALAGGYTWAASAAAHVEVYRSVAKEGPAGPTVKGDRSGPSTR